MIQADEVQVLEVDPEGIAKASIIDGAVYDNVRYNASWKTDCYSSLLARIS